LLIVRSTRYRGAVHAARAHRKDPGLASAKNHVLLPDGTDSFGGTCGLWCANQALEVDQACDALDFLERTLREIGVDAAEVQARDSDRVATVGVLEEAQLIPGMRGQYGEARERRE
jgi:hypothetical protein